MTYGFWIILLSFFLYGFIHSGLASLNTKAQVRRIFGPSADRWFRIVYNMIAFITLLPILLLPILLVDKELYRIPYPWLLVTVGFQVLAGIGLLFGLLQTGVYSFLGVRQLFDSTENEPPKFISSGLYHWVRHPLYSAGLLIIWLFPIMTCNLLALNIGITAYIIIGARLEEQKLEREFGEVYKEYQNQTPMLIPFIRKR